MRELVAVILVLPTIESFHILPLRSPITNNNNAWGRETRKDTSLHAFQIEESSRTWTHASSPGERASSSSTMIHAPTQRTDATSQQQQSRRRLRKQKTQPMPVTGYDARAIEEYYDMRPLQVGWRLNSLGFPLLGWYFGLVWDKLTGRDASVAVQRQRGAQLRHHLVASQSVALIKSGQAVSLRPDLVRNPYWCEELGKLVDAVGAFSDVEAMRIAQRELSDLVPKLQLTKEEWMTSSRRERLRGKMTQLERLVETDPVLSLFEFSNDYRAVASASIGQVYKARLRKGRQLELAIGSAMAAKWGGRLVAVKVQRPNVEASASLDMYLLRRTAMWLSKFRGGDLPKIADAFGIQLFGELDYVREANNYERFRLLYDDWDDVEVPAACEKLTRQRVLVSSWVEGEKGPWHGQDGIDMVSVGLRCSVDQLMNTGLFHAGKNPCSIDSIVDAQQRQHTDPHRGNLLKTPSGKLALGKKQAPYYHSIGLMNCFNQLILVWSLILTKNKDLPLVTENLLKLGFLKDATQLDILVPRLRRALKNSTGGTGKASDVNFARLQAELDEISRENILEFSTPAFFTVIIRSLTILEGIAQSIDKNFRLVRGAYPYVLSQLLNPAYSERQPEALQKLLIRLLTVEGKGEEIEWERLRDLLRLAQRASKAYDPSTPDGDQESKTSVSRKTVELFGKFMTSQTGVFLKKPLVHELAEAIDGMASIGEASLQRFSRGFVPLLPGMKGPVNQRRMEEIGIIVETFRDALVVQNNNSNPSRVEAMIDVFRELLGFISDTRLRENADPLLEELQSVIQMVAVEVLEIRGSRAMRAILQGS